MRVSELCELKLNDVHLAEGILKVKGKGDKERVIPISSYCISQMKYYLDSIRSVWDVKNVSYFCESFRPSLHSAICAFNDQK